MSENISDSERIELVRKELKLDRYIPIESIIKHKRIKFGRYFEILFNNFVSSIWQNQEQSCEYIGEEYPEWVGKPHGEYNWEHLNENENEIEINDAFEDVYSDYELTTDTSYKTISTRFFNYVFSSPMRIAPINGNIN